MSEPWRTGLTGPSAEVYVLPPNTRYLVISTHGGVADAKRTGEITERLEGCVLVSVDDHHASVYVNYPSFTEKE